MSSRDRNEFVSQVPLARVERSGVTARAREADCGRDDETAGFLEDATALEGRWRGEVFMVGGRRGVRRDRMQQFCLASFLVTKESFGRS